MWCIFFCLFQNWLSDVKGLRFLRICYVFSNSYETFYRSILSVFIQLYMYVMYEPSSLWAIGPMSYQLMSDGSYELSTYERWVLWAIDLWAIGPMSDRLMSDHHYERWSLWAKWYERSSCERSSYERSSYNHRSWADGYRLLWWKGGWKRLDESRLEDVWR